MRFKSLSTHHSSFINNLIKQNFSQSSGLQYCPSRFSSLCSPFSLPCVSSKLTRRLSYSCLFSNSSGQFNLNHLNTRFLSRCSNYDDGEIFHDITYEDLTVDKFRELIKVEADEQLIKEILADYEYIKFETGDVPSTIKITHMFELMKMSPKDRSNSFKFLSEKEQFSKSKKLQKSLNPKSTTYYEIQKIIDDGEKPELGLVFDPQTGAPLYGEWLNSHFVRIRQREYRQSFESNLLSSYLFGQRLIIDCDYKYSVLEAKRVAHDIQKSFAQNRCAHEPFNLTLTGLKNELLRDLLSVYSVSFSPTDGNLGIDTYSESFTELFSDQKLIYLSPHAKQELKHFDDEAIYILGGISSKVFTPMSFKKAIACKVPTYCFPTEFLPFRPMKNAKSFDLTESTKILLKFKDSNDIKNAVKEGVRIGRLKRPEEILEEQRKRHIKLQRDKLHSNKRKDKKQKPPKKVPSI